MILNGKDVDIDELMLQLAVENVPEGGDIHGELKKKMVKLGLQMFW